MTIQRPEALRALATAQHGLASPWCLNLLATDPRRIKPPVVLTSHTMERPTGESLDQIDKDSLIDSRGRGFREYKRALRPRFFEVWIELLAGHAALVATALAVVLAERRAPHWFPLTVALGAFGVGSAVAYILLFFHEAAHYNIAKGRRLNDTLANLLIGSLVGQDIRAYRPIHFDHHRFLGTPGDTERTYFDALDFRFIVESLTGIRILKVLLGREKASKEQSTGNVMVGKKSLINAQLLFGFALHASILGLAAWLRHWTFALAWLVGMGIVFPFFAAVRQVLEHRNFAAMKCVNYRLVPHGPTNRIFAGGPLASVLGGAGFNRHLLHHWEPQISYTRLAALERYLLDTSAAPVIQAHTTTYVTTFVRLLSSK
jgi:fatty acid desaturase